MLTLAASNYAHVWCQDKIAASITLEQGKTFEDARGDVLRGLRKLKTIPVVKPVIKFNRNSIPQPVSGFPPSEIAVPPHKVVTPQLAMLFSC